MSDRTSFLLIRSASLIGVTPEVKNTELSSIDKKLKAIATESVIFFENAIIKELENVKPDMELVASYEKSLVFWKLKLAKYSK
jgi:hypothetical protein